MFVLVEKSKTMFVKIVLVIKILIKALVVQDFLISLIKQFSISFKLMENCNKVNTTLNLYK